MNNKHFCIILGGGKSTRMGTPKGLLNFQGECWLQWQMNQLANCEVDNVVIVLGPDYTEYLKVIPHLAPALQDWMNQGTRSLRIVVNADVEAGPFASLQCGIKALPVPRGSGFVLPLDTPCPHPATWKSLKKHMNNSNYRVVIPTFGDKGGHPVLLSPEFVDYLSTVNQKASDARLDQQIRNLPADEVGRHAVFDDRIALNLNTPEEWQSFSGT